MKITQSWLVKKNVVVKNGVPSVAIQWWMTVPEEGAKEEFILKENLGEQASAASIAAWVEFRNLFTGFAGN